MRQFRVVVAIAADGTLTAYGTLTGLPFTSEQTAQRLADVIGDDDVETTVLAVESSDEWSR